MADPDRKSHWERVYTTKDEADVSWYEDTPELSLDLLGEAGLMPSMSVVDIGGGASRLVDGLLAAGQSHVSVLDISAAALETAKSRLAKIDRVHWIVSDITTWMPTQQYDFWHDRAAFHFLTSAQDQRAYVRVLSKALKRGGRAIIGTFAPDGPEKCSGLTVARYDAEALQAVIGRGFRLMAARRHEHSTPWGAIQKFQFCTFENIDER